MQRLHHRQSLPTIVFLAICLLAVNHVDGAEFPPAFLLAPRIPEPPFAQEVEVTFTPVFQTQWPDEEVHATLSIKNLSMGSIRLPHQWEQSGTLCDLRLKIDQIFASRYGIVVREFDGNGISAIRRLQSGGTACMDIRLDHYLQITSPIREPIPVTWHLSLRQGQEKSGHFTLRFQVPMDALDEAMERYQQEQDAFLPTIEIQLLPAP